MTRRSSTAASTRLAVEASVASIRSRTVWPAKALSEAVALDHAPLTFVAAPSRS